MALIFSGKISRDGDTMVPVQGLELWNTSVQVCTWMCVVYVAHMNCCMEKALLFCWSLLPSSLRFREAEQWCSMGMKFLNHLSHLKQTYEEQVCMPNSDILRVHFCSLLFPPTTDDYHLHGSIVPSPVSPSSHFAIVCLQSVCRSDYPSNHVLVLYLSENKMREFSVILE